MYSVNFEYSITWICPRRFCYPNLARIFVSALTNRGVSIPKGQSIYLEEPWQEYWVPGNSSQYCCHGDWPKRSKHNKWTLHHFWTANRKENLILHTFWKDGNAIVRIWKSLHKRFFLPPEKINLTKCQSANVPKPVWAISGEHLI